MPTPYAIGPTASGLLNMPMPSTEPFGPAGIPGATKQGWATGLQGIAGAMPYAQQFGQGMGALSNLGMQALGRGQMGFDPRLAGLIGDFGSVGGPIAPGGAFDPFDNPALMKSIQAGNEQLGRDFRQGVMRPMNQTLAGAGPGAYGGTRAGVAQGIAEQGLADAMSRQTSDRLSSAYDSGLQALMQGRGQDVSSAGQRLQALLGAQGQQQAGFFGLPGLLQSAYSAQLAPKELTSQLANALGAIGGQQQGQSQSVLDWYNRQAGQRGAYPSQMFGQYAGTMTPFLTPGSFGTSAVTGQSQGQGQGQGANFGDILGGAGAGLKIYDTWNRYSNQPGAAGGGYTPVGNPYNPGVDLAGSGTGGVYF